MNKQYRAWLNVVLCVLDETPHDIRLAFEAGLTPGEAIALVK